MTETAKPEQYNITVLSKDPNHIFELKTTADAIVPITMKGILALTPVPKNERAPNSNEAMCLLDTILGQRANPYANECGLMPIYSGGFRYGVWVAAQVRMRKAQAQQDYDGYIWGWITKDGKRHNPGRESVANPDEVIGVWGEVYRKGQAKPFYHETYLAEFSKKKDGGKGTWDKMEKGMILKVNRDQTHKFAYADCMGNLNTADELNAYQQEPLPPPACDTPNRDDRRKPVESVVLKSEDGQSSISGSATNGVQGNRGAEAKTTQPAPDTDGSKEAEGAEEDLLKYDEVFIFYTELGGKEWEKYAAYVIAGDEEDIAPDKLTVEQLGQIKREIETSGVEGA